MSNSRYTPYQLEIVRLIDAYGIELTRIGAADLALTRRIVNPDLGASERVHVTDATTSDPTGNEAMHLLYSHGQRDAYHKFIADAWEHFRKHRQATDSVLANEPVITHAGIVCATKTCANYASPHIHPVHGTTIDELCDDCWRNICTGCYLRPMEQYRKTCDACRKREERAA